MANVMLSFPQRADEATLSGGAWAAGLPLNNLKDRLIGKVARTTDALAASSTFDAALTKARSIRTLSLINNNLSLGATYRLRGSDDPTFATSITDTGTLPVWPALYVTLALEWEADNWWSGEMLAEDIEGYTWNLIHVFATNVVARYWRIELTDTANAAGYVQAGRLFMAPAFQPLQNMSYGASTNYETRTAIEEAPSGVEYFDRRNGFRVARFNLDWQTEDEAMVNSFEMQRILGIDKELLYIFDPDNLTHKIRKSFLGRLRTLNAIEQPYFDTLKSSYEIKELL